MRLFVDMDGVLADFDAHHAAVFGHRPDKIADDVVWERVRAVPNFYFSLPPMPDMQELWDYVGGHDPVILTGVPSAVPEAADDKRAWARRYVGPHVEVRCCLSKEKSLHATPGDVLIDDWEKYRALWIAKGGRWITHRTAADTIEQLRRIGF
jgi:hypothetical protein